MNIPVATWLLMTACLLPILYTELMLVEKSLSSRLLSLGSELHGLTWARLALSCSVRKTNCPSLWERNKDSIFCFAVPTQINHLTADRLKRISYQRQHVFVTSLRWTYRGKASKGLTWALCTNPVRPVELWVPIKTPRPRIRRPWISTTSPRLSWSSSRPTGL